MIKKLPKTKKKNGCYYELLKRTENTAIYSQRYGRGKPIIGFEVFRILTPIYKPFYGNSPTPSHYAEEFDRYEKFPSNEDFGKTAFTYSSRIMAEKKFQELEEKAIENIGVLVPNQKLYIE